ncbi:MAG: ABC transporter permease [Burkholderiales bacterium]|nr:ABC transporter permease [Burkholderiales bacterium]
MHITTIGRYTALEALRTRVPATALLTLCLLLGASLFIRELAVTESSRFQIGFYAAAARLCAVFIASLYVLASITREFNDKGLEVVLALDVPRSHYICGKLAGFMLVALVCAVVLSLPLWALAPAAAAGLWTASLAIELALITALSLFCIVTFSQLLPAAGFVVAFYLLARSVTAMRLMSASPLAGQDTLSHQVTSMLVEGLGYLLPALDRWTDTAWLLDAAPEPALLLAIAAQGAIYITLLAAATVFDFYRRSL